MSEYKHLITENKGKETKFFKCELAPKGEMDHCNNCSNRKKCWGPSGNIYNEWWR